MPKTKMNKKTKEQLAKLVEDIKSIDELIIRSENNLSLDPRISTAQSNLAIAKLLHKIATFQAQNI